MEKKHGFDTPFRKYLCMVRQFNLCKCLIVWCSLFASLANAHAQKGAISLHVKDVPIINVIEIIKKQTDSHFSYSTELEAWLKEKKVSIDVDNETIEKTLTFIFKATDITYKIVDNNILLSKKNSGQEQGNTPSQSSRRATLSGYVKNSSTGEELIGSTVAIKELPGIGSSTNAYGFYSITIPAGTYTCTVSYVGYEQDTAQIILNQSLRQDFTLNEQSTKLEEVVVTSRRMDENVTKMQMGMQNLEMKDIKNIPVILGEKDALKIIQLLPGIKSESDGSSGISVRGGAADQNLILLDEATVYNASHLLGFFSVFNSDAIKNISVYKGNEPAEYGGRQSSVLDIKMNDGNDKKFSVNGGVGLISSKLSIEGPLAKDKSSFIISARRTYADMFLKLLFNANKAKLYFYDLNAKANYRIDNKNRIFLSGYFGKDVFGFGNSYGIKWGNATGTLRWNHLFSDRLFSNTSLILSNYEYTINIKSGLDLNILSCIRDYTLKQDFQYYIGANNTLKFGFITMFHKFIPGAITSSDISFRNSSLPDNYSLESAVYVSHQYKFSDNLGVEYGLRASTFSLLGPGNFYTYDKEGNTTDTMIFKRGKNVKTYSNIEPRITFNYAINRESSVKASYSRNVQNLHLLSNSTSGNPTDVWIPSSNNVKPEIADQVALGYYRNISDNKFEFSTEIYYKNLQNQIDFKNGAELNFNKTVESQILSGKGRAFGTELFIKKNSGKLTGWISYTLSRTERKFDEINNGHYFPAKQDRTHDIAIVGIYELNKRWTLSATWVYSTGNAVTFPSGKYPIEGETQFYYTERNGYRMPAYHRLDIGATWIKKKTDKFESSWTFSLYNAYGHSNAYMISFRDDGTSRTNAYQVILFKFIPSFSYNFKF